MACNSFLPSYLTEEHYRVSLESEKGSPNFLAKLSHLCNNISSSQQHIFGKKDSRYGVMIFYAYVLLFITAVFFWSVFWRPPSCIQGEVQQKCSEIPMAMRLQTSADSPPQVRLSFRYYPMDKYLSLNCYILIIPQSNARINN